MPIIGLTTNREAAFPRIGVLRKGGEKQKNKDGKEVYGKDLTYFRFDSEDKQAIGDFEQAYGKEPSSINVYLPFPTPDENFQAWQEEYRAGGLVHRCDGETMTVWLTAEGKYSNEPKACPYHAGTAQRTVKEPGCKATGRLTVIVPELRRFAYVTSLTNSKNDIMELTDNLNAVYAMRGTLQGIPFRLIRRPRMISTPKADGSRARYEKWMLSLEVNPDWAALQLESMRKQAMLPVGQKLLGSGHIVDNVTGEVIDDEDSDLSNLDSVGDMDWDVDDTQATASDEFGDIPSVPKGQTSSTHTAAQAAKLEGPLLRKFHAVGNTLYGDAWEDKRPELVKATTKGRAVSSSDMTEGEANYLIGLMQKRINAGEAKGKPKDENGVEHSLAHSLAEVLEKHHGDEEGIPF